MPICIAGMHRSGTSMTTHLLHLCGLHLGPGTRLFNPDNPDLFDADIRDNPEGYWENLDFVHLNERILQSFNGDFYHVPELQPGWAEDKRLQPFYQEANEILSQFPADQLWGWKDPRNSLTLAFWQKLLPELRILLCIRNPLEVADSITARGWNTTASALDWWRRYHDILAQTLHHNDYAITHYETYFYDPAGELRRICAFLGLEPSEQTIEAAMQTIRDDLHRHRHPEAMLEYANIPADLLTLYRKFAAEAGSVYAAMCRDESYQLRIARDVLMKLYQNPRSLPQIRPLMNEITHKEAQIQNQAEQLQKIRSETIAVMKEHQDLKTAYEALQRRYTMIRLPTIGDIKSLPRSIYHRLIPYEKRRKWWLKRQRASEKSADL